MNSLNSLKKAILADGKIDATEVAEIKKMIYEDGKVDLEEVNFLFDLNNKCSNAKNHSSWATLFVEAISSYLLEDLKSPGEIDKNEARWLLKKIQGDGKLDSTEKRLLRKLKKDSKGMPDNLKIFISDNI